jgi:hypothetical protein
MPTQPHDFKSKNVTREIDAGLRGFKRAGVPVSHVEIDARTGNAIIYAKTGDTLPVVSDPDQALADWRAGNV